MQLHQQGKLDQASHIYNQILAQLPTQAQALQCLGVLESQRGNAARAEELLRRSLQLQSDVPETKLNLALLLMQSSRAPEAIELLRDLVLTHPAFVPGWSALGSALKDAGDQTGALECARRMTELAPDAAFAHLNLGIALLEDQQPALAIESLQQAMSLDPSDYAVWDTAGVALRHAGKIADAERAHRRATQLQPQAPTAYANLAADLLGQGRAVEAVAACEKAVALSPADPQLLSGLLMTLHYLADLPPAVLAERHQGYGRLFAPAAARPTTSGDRVCIGYVSGDLRDHPVGRFMAPILTHHDRARFRIVCFAQSRADDEMTRRLRACADSWHAIVGRSDMEVADLIHAEKVDILIDLAGHSADNRLPVFALKPAPVQVSYLGYPNTTGLPAIDFRLTDAAADPAGADDAVYVERLIRLPRTAWCFDPPIDAPEPGPLPARAAGHVTFGSFNHLPKVNDPLIALWARVLNAVPGSQLLIKATALAEPATRDRLLAEFARHDVSADRIELAPATKTHGEHLAMYQRVDIALDTFPYHGTMTTCEALWMGVPVITLAGATHHARVGVSLLGTVGMSDLVASTPEAYVEVAGRLASDLDALEATRRALRTRVQGSALTDAPAMARDLEATYAQMLAIKTI
jgi:protein O-GlcNAc transferase